MATLETQEMQQSTDTIERNGNSCGKMGGKARFEFAVTVRVALDDCMSQGKTG